MDFHYDYVANENNVWKKTFDHRNGSPYNEYSYDDSDRLTRADYLKGQTTEYEAFTMDDLGNRTGIQTLRGGGTDEYSVDSLTNRYTAIDASPLGYDAAGNLTQDKDDYLYTCDYENRITKIEKPDGPDTGSDPDPVAEFAYDTQGRRIRVFNAVAGKETLYYYSDNWQVLLSVTDESQNGSEWKLFVYGNYIDEVLRRERYFLINGQKAAAGPLVMYYLHDHLYSPAALVDSVGTVFERYEYDAYGKVTVWNGDYSTSYNASQYGNPYTFTGRELDVLDNGSLKLMHYRHRAYDTYTGRFMQCDPLGINPSGGLRNPFNAQKQYSDGMNNYEYVISNPEAYIDPYGFQIKVYTRSLDQNTFNRFIAYAGAYIFVPITTPLVAYYDATTRHCVLIIEKCDGTVLTWDFQSDGQVYHPAKSTENKVRNAKTTTVYSKHDKDSLVESNAGLMSPGTYHVTGNNCCHWVENVLQQSGISYRNPNPWPFN